MKTITNYLSKHSALALIASMFLFASCSKQTAYVSQYDKLAYEQTVLPTSNTEEIAQIPAEIASVEIPAEMAVAPLLNTKAIETKAVAGKKQNKALAAFNNVKEKAPKAVKNITAENLASVSLLASSAQSIKKSMMDGNLKLAIVFLLVSIIAGYFSWILGLIFGVIGLIFLILWVLSL